MPEKDGVVLITGVNGFIGRRLAISLAQDGTRVLGVSRTRLTADLISAGIEDVSSEFREHSATLPQRLDVVVHLAGNARFGNGRFYRSDNVHQTQHLMRYLSRNGSQSPTRVVFASSIGAMDAPTRPGGLLDETSAAQPTSDYGRSKLQSEAVVQGSVIDEVYIARLGMVFGPGMRHGSHLSVLKRVLDRHPWALPLLRQLNGSLPIVHVDDAVSALKMMVHGECPTGTYIVVAENVPVGRAASILGGDGDTQPSMGRAVRLPQAVPFQVRAVLAPLLTYNSGKLRSHGWNPSNQLVLLKETFTPGILVTGANSGLGLALTTEALARGLQVTAIDVSSDELDPLLSRFPRQLSVCQTDVRDLPRFAELVLEPSPGWLQIAYLNAGIGRKAALEDMRTSDIEDQIGVNLEARALQTRELVRMAKDGVRDVRVTLVSSSTAQMPLAYFSVYAATAAGVDAFGRAMASEVGSAGAAHVTVVLPDGMKTNFQRRAGVGHADRRDLLDPRMVAQRLLDHDLGQSPQSRILVGSRVATISLFRRLLPTTWLDRKLSEASLRLH